MPADIGVSLFCSCICFHSLKERYKNVQPDKIYIPHPNHCAWHDRRQMQATVCRIAPTALYTFMTWRAHAVGSRHKHFPATLNTSPRTAFAITVHRFPSVYLLSSCTCFAACIVTQTRSMLGEDDFRTGNQYHNYIGLSINLSTRYSWASHILRVTLFPYTRHRIHEGLLFVFRRPPSLIICSLSRLAGTRLSSRCWSESRFCQQKRDIDQSREGNRAVRFPNRYKMASSSRLRDVLWIQAQM